ncbi:calcium-binding protein [Synechococcus sp. J7-Johnson]|uniref:calcium-binding protein n=1 Tax=Synechococcus sp. J7-Johnson TaxID=2823737 RepID=UPI0020CDE105|nr:hypothetical protein [Synechococcus sp. J7-Johnson]
MTFQEVSSKDRDAKIQVVLGDTGDSSGYWSATWSTVRTAAGITLSSDLDSDLFAVAASHEVANVLGLGDIDGGGYVESITLDPFSGFHLASSSINYLTRIDYELINQVYDEEATDYLDYLVHHSGFSEVYLGDSTSAFSEFFSGSDGEGLIHGFKGDDTLDGGSGDDLLIAGAGQDLIIGGDGADVMYGGFGGNVFGDSRDSDADQMFIRSDHFLDSHFNGATLSDASAGVVDIIEGLDSYDNIFIEAGFSRSLEVRESAGGLGLYVDGIFEAIYIGQDLTAVQLISMTEIVAA